MTKKDSSKIRSTGNEKKDSAKRAEKERKKKVAMEKQFLEAIAAKQQERNRMWRHEEEKNLAAAKIQALMRGARLRKEVGMMKSVAAGFSARQRS